MQLFLFEEEIKNVPCKTTKGYLEEVVGLYYNKNYRASIIMLYSVVWHDLIKKIEFLAEMYADEKAVKFLKDFEASSAKNTKYSDLECKIFAFAKEQGFLNGVEVNQVNYLKETRDYCAHPVFTNRFELITPNREQVAAHIRNMFEAVFLKDAILNKKVFRELLEKIEEFYERNKLEGLERYLGDRYFKRMNEYVKKDIFKQLWRLTFHSTDAEPTKNRECLYYSLCYLINTDKRFFMEFLEEEKEWFNSKILFEKIDLLFNAKVNNPDNKPLLYLIEIIIEYPEIYILLNESNKVEVENVINKNINLLLRCVFLNNNIEGHLEKCITRIKREESKWCDCATAFIELYEKFKMEGCNLGIFNKFAIEYFYSCMNGVYYPDFDYINWTYRDIIVKLINDFNNEEKLMFIEGYRSSYDQAHCSGDIKHYIEKFKNELEVDEDICS